MATCCVPLCTSRGDQKKNIDKKGKQITFHEFPSDSKRRELWLKVINFQEDLPTRFCKPLEKADKSVICNLHFQPKDFYSGVKIQSLLPDAVPSIFPSYRTHMKKMAKRKRMGSAKKNEPISKVVCEKPSVSENKPSSSVQDSATDKNDDNRENKDTLQKDNVSTVEKCFTFKSLHKSLSLIKKPNQYWGVTPTDKFIIFSRWNDKYIPEKRIVIESNLNIKVFLGELEINIMNLMEFTCAEDVTNLLDKVDNITIFGKEPVISELN